MKTKINISIFLFFIIVLKSYSQDTNCHLLNDCDFTNECAFISINKNDTNNIWQIGTTAKFIDTASLKNKSIITDTVNPYKIKCNSYFEVSIPDSFPIWSSVNIRFHHKFQTDSLLDGGYIMVSYDYKKKWENIIFSHYPNDYEYGINGHTNNLYSIDDTLNDGTPAFTGQQDWIWSKIEWWSTMACKCKGILTPDTIYLRFYFKSDSIQTNKKGWIIDEFKTEYCDRDVGIIEMNDDIKIKISPNPTNGKVLISLKNANEKYTLEILNTFGQIIINKKITNNVEAVDLSSQPVGIYFVKLQSSNNTVVKKIIKE